MSGGCCDGKVVVYEHMGRYYMVGDSYHKEITKHEYDLFRAQEQAAMEIDRKNNTNSNNDYGKEKS